MVKLHITGVKRQILICMSLYQAQIIGGYAGSWSGPVLPKLNDLKQSPLPYLLTEAEQSFLASLIFLGCVFGPYVITWISNSRGRKPCFLVGGLASIMGYVTMLTTNNLAMLFISRFMLGVADSILFINNLVYIGEIASPRIRGILLTTTGVFTACGLLLMYIIGPYLSFYELAYIGLGLSIIYMISLVWIPESPLFYAMKGREEQVAKTLKALGRSDDTQAIMKMSNEAAMLNETKDWKEMFTIRSNRKAFFIVMTINCLQHSSGIFAVVFFSASIFEMAGSPMESNLAMTIVTSFQLAGSLITPLFIENVGRRKILLISTAVCSLSMFTLGFYFYLDNIKSPVVQNIKWLPLTTLVFFFISYDSGFGIIPNALAGEMFTANVRSKGSTITLSTAYLVDFLVTAAFGALLEVVGGHVAFWFFAGTCACAFLFTVLYIPETKGKSLMEIQENL